MKTFLKVISVVAITAIFITSCSRKKDSFVSRNFHAVATEYNTLYNGYNALQEGKITLNESYKDNYWEILPIERMQVSDEVILPGESENENFTRAEEKAVKAIQKHSMNIKGKEKNPQIDEAYLLLGKARYFDQRFVPALDAFNNILNKYPTSDKINQVKIWKEKANIRLENEELAIKNLKRLLEEEELEDQDLADAASMLAQAYINTKSIDSAVTQLEIASNATKNNDERGRFRFIQGQLYNELGYKDSANIAFDKVIELHRKTPRIYLIAAHIGKAKNFDFENQDKLAFHELLTDLEEDRENRPYLDKIYHQIAQYHLNNGSDSLAVEYFNKSLREPSEDKRLKARSYEVLAEMSFNNSLYKEAGAYYDSTLTNLEQSTKEFRVVKRKRDNLEDVIYYENIVQVDDSIMNLVGMSEAQKLKFFTHYIDILKAKVEAEKEKQEIIERNKGLVVADKNSKGNRPGLQGSLNRSGGLPNQASTFYFYNPTTVSFGKNEFIKVWGDRQLEDNWRWSNKTSSGLNNTNTIDDVLATASEDELYDPEFYISKIPSTEKEIDSITKERNYAYYQLGLIYKEKFKEYDLAKTKLQQLLSNNPEERLVLPAKYNLYKIYSVLENNDEAEIAKNDIITNYPDSRYATILMNPELASTKDESSPESLYKNLYKLHEKQEYVEVISKCDEYINMFDGDAMVAKFELLKANAIGRLYGYEPYAKAINYVALNYPNDIEGKKAENISLNMLPKLASKEFVDDTLEKNVKAVYMFNNPKEEELNTFITTLNEVIGNSHFKNIVVSTDVYDLDTLLVLVHGLEYIDEAKMFNLLFKEEDRNKVKKPDFVISSSNYQIVQIHKNLDEYLSINNN
ncbi:tetratricopeptide repeat protein [Yeosuana sp. MJ-SS3]|uniref:Tetratricopeptide repeat protein n=1 Tax=Gilvirhabdus luticola TaxID=3079858 RepID=A0ABU3U3B5_9FLAO|nr:tetratricopeptide repeat protein [Yeosuana sp. MJ-SS3]MDU8884625.1 tetratricopeptide repeat protein [Yeosuana sp. MJ-SS3]